MRYPYNLRIQALSRGLSVSTVYAGDQLRPTLRRVGPVERKRITLGGASWAMGEHRRIEERRLFKIVVPLWDIFEYQIIGDQVKDWPMITVLYLLVFQARRELREHGEHPADDSSLNFLFVFFMHL